MPHIIIEYSDTVCVETDMNLLLDKVFEAVEETGLFAPENIKVRIMPVNFYRLYKPQSGFVHVQCRIHRGRDKDQKKHLTQTVLTVLKALLSDSAVMTAEVVDMDTSSYSKLIID